MRILSGGSAILEALKWDRPSAADPYYGISVNDDGEIVRGKHSTPTPTSQRR